jgi:hypothetical protein
MLIYLQGDKPCIHGIGDLWIELSNWLATLMLTGRMRYAQCAFS